MRSFIVLVVTILALLEVGSFQSLRAQQKSADENQEEALKEARRLADEFSDKIRGLHVEWLSVTIGDRRLWR